jgi:hypothetical protein
MNRRRPNSSALMVRNLRYRLEGVQTVKYFIHFGREKLLQLAY